MQSRRNRYKWAVSVRRIVKMSRLQFFVFSRCCFKRHSWICLMIYSVSFLGLFPLLFKDMRYSLYYRNPFRNSSSEMDYHMRQNELRVARASQFWSSHGTSGSFDFTKKQKDIDIDVMIVTTFRHNSLVKGKNPKFLTQILWQFFHILNDPETRGLPWKISLSVCNVDSKHHEEARNFSSVVQYFQRYSDEPRGVLGLNIKEKEKQDYAFCLEESLKANPRYSLLVEDDAFPHPQLFYILYHLLEIRRNAMASRNHGSDVLFYKLYHPERLQGFLSIQPERIPELISFASLFGTCSTLLVSYLLPKRTNARSRSFNFIWFLLVVYFALTAIAVSRQHLNELRYISKNLFSVGPTPSCCTPGMLFVADKAQHWLNYLKNHTCRLNYGKDTMLDDYRRKSNIRGLIVQPNLFVHIGFLSSLSEKLLDPSLMYYPLWFKLF